MQEYGKSAHLLGFKSSYNIAIEHVAEEEKVKFASIIQHWFERPVNVLNNFYEASLTNSNPLLHTSRLYTMFGGKMKVEYTHVCYFSMKNGQKKLLTYI